LCFIHSETNLTTVAENRDGSPTPKTLLGVTKREHETRYNSYLFVTIVTIEYHCCSHI